MDSSKVKVVVRCRPLLPREAAGGNSSRTFSSLRVTPGQRQVVLGDGKGYNFDHVYDQSSGQEHIYESCVAPLVEGCFNGYNATVLAYGQTGSGKTYTMGSAPTNKADDGSDEGIIPRAVKHIFDLIETEHASKVVNIKVSFLEIYNEEMRDLLHSDVSPRDIALREDSEGRIFFTGAREEVCSSAMDVFRCLERGAVGRTTAETWMNDASSRSHAIFTIAIDACDTSEAVTAQDTPRVASKYIQSKLHLVDLAGSERAKKTGAVGLRLKESVGINQGLMSLGKVIRALTAPSNRGGSGLGGQLLSTGPTAAHVPYRESKLTRFLQDSLGGNSQTVMLACVTPSDTSFHETASTLQYASRARMVQNKVVANVTLAPPPEVEEGLVTALRSQLQQAQSDLEQARKAADVSGLMLHMRRSLDDSGLLDRSIDRGRPAPLKDAQWHLVAALVDGVRQCESRLQDGVADAESFLLVAESEPTAVTDTVSQLADLAAVASRCVAGLKALHTVDATSEVVRVARAMATSAINNSSSNKGEGTTQAVAEKDLEIMRLRGELDECRDDLRRDEEIFAEKMKELKKNKKEVKRLTTENVSLKMAAQSAQEALRAELDRSPPAEQRHVSSPARDKHTTHDSLVGGLASADDANMTVEEQEMSFAVAACEPDVSQLMEDFEALSKEKDDLLAEKQQAEDKVKEITLAAESEKNSYTQSKETLQRRLKELEVGMKLKQEVISSLARKQQEASDLAEKYESRVEELQSVTSRLTIEIKRLSDRSAAQGEIAEAKSAPPASHMKSRDFALRKSEQEEKKVYYEEQLRLAQEQLLDLQRQRGSVDNLAQPSGHGDSRPVAEGKPRLATEDSKQLRKELDSMRQEYTELTKLIEQEDIKQKRNLEELKSQVELHRKNASDYMRKIKKLEKLNLQYQQNMDVNQLRKLQEKQHQLLTGAADRPDSAASDHTGYLRRFKTGTNTPTKGTARGNRPTSAPLANAAAGNKAVVANGTKWLEARIDELVQLKFKQVEMTAFSDQLVELKSDRLTLINDLEAMKRQQKDGANNINKQLTEVEDKILCITAQITADREELERDHRRSDSGDEEERAEAELKILTRISESQRAVRSYQERQRELKMRLDNGVLAEAALNKMNDLQDNLDALNSEVQFIENRVAGKNGAATEGIVAHNPWNTPTGKPHKLNRGSGSSISEGPSDKTLRDALFGDLQRIDEATATRLLLFLAHEMIDAKFRLTKEDHSCAQLKSQLEEMSAERDKLSEAMKRSNLEFAAKVDALKTENETKVAFLVQQLRGAEDKVRSSAVGATMRRSGVGSGGSAPGSSEAMSPSSRAFSLMFDATKSAAATTINRPNTAGVSAAWANVGNRHRTSGEAAWPVAVEVGSPGASVSEISRRMASKKQSLRGSADGDTVLTESCEGRSINSNSIMNNDTTSSNHLWHKNSSMIAPAPSGEDELKRKWTAEKQRREQLEKRNMELTRELRSLRNKVESSVAN